MTASLIQTPRLQFTLADGSVAAGGTVATYIPSTFTPATTYQDQAGTIPNANPLTLDAIGSCSMWGTGSYRMIVVDANNNTIFDEVTTAPASSSDVLLAANNLSDLTSVSAARTNMGLGTAALVDTGGSGALVPLCSSNITWSGSQTWTGTARFNSSVTIAPPGGAFTARAGYLGIPIIFQTGSYQFVLTDRASNRFFTNTATVTIPANASVAFDIGDFLMATWPSGTTGTLALTSDTLVWPIGNLSGTRTITGPGYIVAMKMFTTEWWITGSANVT